LMSMLEESFATSSELLNQLKAAVK
jgi:hypothetical protein